MSLYRDTGVVLRTYKLGEADRIVVLMTAEHGKVRAVAKGVRKTKSRFGGRLEPLSHVSLLLYEGRELDMVTQAESIDHFRALRDDLGRLTRGIALLEAVDQLAQEREPNLRLYQMLRRRAAGADDGRQPARSWPPSSGSCWRPRGSTRSWTAAWRAARPSRSWPSTSTKVACCAAPVAAACRSARRARAPAPGSGRRPGRRAARDPVGGHPRGGHPRRGGGGAPHRAPAARRERAGSGVNTPDARRARSLDDMLEAARSCFERLTPRQAWRAVQEGALVVDVRPVDQRQRDGEVPGAVIVARNVLEWRLEPGGPWAMPEATGSDQHVILVCDEGCSTQLAAAGLVRLGLDRVSDVIGGMQAWLADGLPTVPAGTCVDRSPASRIDAGS